MKATEVKPRLNNLDGWVGGPRFGRKEQKIGIGCSHRVHQRFFDFIYLLVLLLRQRLLILLRRILRMLRRSLLVAHCVP